MVDRILPLLEARCAHELSQSGHTRGKIVLRYRQFYIDIEKSKSCNLRVAQRFWVQTH